MGPEEEMVSFLGLVREGFAKERTLEVDLEKNGLEFPDRE